MNTMKIIALKEQGRLQKGDRISTPTLGECTVEIIASIDTIIVMDQARQRCRISGLVTSEDTVLT